MTSEHRKPFVGGNWKMNGDRATGRELARGVAGEVGAMTDAVDVAVFPALPFLDAVGGTLSDSGVMLGSQDVYHQGNGAFTGEVSVEMLRDLGVGAVLAGHSERRHVIGEDDRTVNKKIVATIAGGMISVLCVGETLEQREAGETDRVNEQQTRLGLAGVEAADLEKVVIAYEPVWAIGTGKTATPEDAQDAHAKIRAVIADLYDDNAASAIRIIYGGSMKPGNAEALMAMPDIDGGLIGGASLNAADFGAIVRAGAAVAR